MSTPAAIANHNRLPVTTLCGFLGAGKTTTLKRVLEAKRDANEKFRCAVVVNDVAELNIDKKLIDDSALLQSDEVVAMQNGCVCCSLSGDFVKQIGDMAKSGNFDYMIVEASGVSEPAEIAKLFANCEDDHDHEAAHVDEHEHLSTLARLDTCVTVIAAGDFLDMIDSFRASAVNRQSYSQLLAEQIEYANVVVLNKVDTVDDEQLAEIKAQIQLLNSRADILEAVNGAIDVTRIVNTKLYKENDFAGFITWEQEIEATSVKSCCAGARDKGESPCCKRARMRETALSEVTLAPSSSQTRHDSRFGITSFIYRARRPFHPKRFLGSFVERFFSSLEADDRDEEKDEETPSVDWSAVKDIRARQEAMKLKRRKREGEIGVLLRSKGVTWLSDAHDLIIVFSQAGNIYSLEGSSRWTALNKNAWVGSQGIKQELRKDWEGPYGDRRQELVFIGKDLKYDEIQSTLDSCLLTDEEFEMGSDGWRAVMGDVFLDEDDEDADDEVDDEDDEEIDEDLVDDEEIEEEIRPQPTSKSKAKPKAKSAPSQNDGADAAGGRVVEDRRYGIYDARRYRSEAENDAAEAAASKGGKVSAASKRKAPTSSSAAAPKKSAKQTVKVEDTEIWYEQPNVAKAGAAVMPKKSQQFRAAPQSAPGSIPSWRRKRAATRVTIGRPVAGPTSWAAIGQHIIKE